MPNRIKPFIHLFKTFLGYYLYDVNTGQIIEINKDTYILLSKDDIDYDTASDELNLLLDNGYLKPNQVQLVKHSYTDLIPFALKTKVRALILQITQNCNLHCDYCIYSGNYNTRTHQNKKMSFNTAKKAIDFLNSNSVQKNNLYIVFYGGEPLLEFNLIKDCVSYARNTIKDKSIHFSMTTNATLLNQEIIDYIVENNIEITVSLDGPKEIQNHSRKFAHSNIGSYDTLMENLQYFKENYPDYFKDKVRINAVLSTENSFSFSDDFFKTIDTEGILSYPFCSLYIIKGW